MGLKITYEIFDLQDAYAFTNKKKWCESRFGNRCIFTKEVDIITFMSRHSIIFDNEEDMFLFRIMWG
jgi:hypothetical protein